MKLSQAIKMALMAISGNKLRSFLTMLGIIIGVTSVSMLISLGESTTSEVTSSISSLGSNLLVATIRTAKPTYLTPEDLRELVGTGGISAVSPLVSGSRTIKAGRLTTSGQIEGVGPDYAQIRDMALADGHFLNQADLDQRAFVAVIGVDIADELFGNRQVLGNQIKIDGRTFTVIGLLEATGTTIAGSNDNRALIPFTTAQRLLRQTTLRTFYAVTAEPQDVFAAEAALHDFLLRRLHDPDAYMVFNQTALLDTINQVTALLTLLLGGIAGISLLVGGIGIMNIMLVSVTERTREIGIRKAIGARRSDIIIQFLVEAVVLSLAGGLIGVALSLIGLEVISRQAGFQLTLTLPVGILALSFSVLIGLIFGIYPAAKASGLKPIDALRHE